MFSEYSCCWLTHENVMMAHAFHLFGPHSLSLHHITSHRITFSSLDSRFARVLLASISSLACVVVAAFTALMLVIARRISFSIFHSFFLQNIKRWIYVDIRYYTWLEMFIPFRFAQAQCLSLCVCRRLLPFLLLLLNR